MKNTTKHAFGNASRNLAKVAQNKKHDKSRDRTLSHWRVLNTLDQYARFTKSKTSREVIHDLKMTLAEHEKEKHAIRAERNRIYSLGVRTGIHLHYEPEKILEQDRRMDKKLRKDVLKKAKDLYRHNSLTRSFAPPKMIAKDKNKYKGLEK